MKMQEIKVPNAEKSAAMVKIFVYLLIAIVATFIVIKLIKFFSEDPEVRKSREKTQKAYTDSANQILNSQSQTMSDAAITLIADQIYEDLKYSSLDDNKSDAELQLKKVNNDADFIKLNDLFGTRNEWFFGINTGSAPFIQYVTSNLSRSRLDNINEVYKQKGIQFRW